VQLQKKGTGLIKHFQPETKFSYMHVSYCTSLVSIFTTNETKFVANIQNDKALFIGIYISNKINRSYSENLSISGKKKNDPTIDLLFLKQENMQN
jgi:hypothetical protein